MKVNQGKRSRRPTRRGGVKQRARALIKRQIQLVQKELETRFPPSGPSSHPGEPCYSPVSEASTICLGPRSPQLIDLTEEPELESVNVAETNEIPAEILAIIFNLQE
ncbi:uncharacterized protein LOC117611352 [Osmia lignaria lignaria]|uniref:uncharacterized protein LOC117611051 n=1 Tax=Osmia lignaria lignaria TaxID=1437193 RepID=UPI001478225B|nr:uncharacterized protein LOC117611051 [Osmia lignaria]XP_034194833.1 uncharacterized protein LOC117611052 [Osmia lignaria]